MYSSDRLAAVVPTKDRPEDVKRLLDSIRKQTNRPGLVVIVDSGGASKEEVQKYLGTLNINYIDTNIVGQIAQRNYGITLVPEQFELIAYLDDDIVLDEHAMENMIREWNRKEKETAGIGFLINNNNEPADGIIRKLFYMGSGKPGEILKSGYNVPVSKMNGTARSGWLCGGATVWKRTIIEENKHRQIRSKWAICEDIIFSYPIGKKYPLYISPDSIVIHNEQPISSRFDTRYIYRGKNTVLWRMYFVRLNEELSILAFTWMTVSQIMMRLGKALLTLKPNEGLLALGQVYGLGAGLLATLRGRDPVRTIDEGEERL